MVRMPNLRSSGSGEGRSPCQGHQGFKGIEAIGIQGDSVILLRQAQRTNRQVNVRKEVVVKDGALICREASDQGNVGREARIEADSPAEGPAGKLKTAG